MARVWTLWDVLQRGITKSRLKGRKSVSSMEKVARRICGAGGIPADIPAAHVTEMRIDEYIEGRRAAGVAPATINRDLAQLRRGFRVAYKTLDEDGHRMVERVPEVELLEEDNVREHFPTEDDYRAIRAKLPWVLPYLLDFYRVTGYRKNEPLCIRWAQVDRAAGRIQLSRADSKSRKWRSAWPYKAHPVLRAAVDALWLAKQGVERDRGVVVTHLFFWQDGRAIKSFRHAYERARSEAGRAHIWIHDFRRAAARDLIKSGSDQKTARRLLGAKTPHIFDRYHIVTEQDEEEAAERLGAYYEAQGPAPQLILPFSAHGARQRNLSNA